MRRSSCAQFRHLREDHLSTVQPHACVHRRAGAWILRRVKPASGAPEVRSAEGHAEDGGVGLSSDSGADLPGPKAPAGRLLRLWGQGPALGT